MLAVVDSWDAAFRGYNDAKHYHNEGKIYATDDTHADGAQLQGRTEVSVFHMAALNSHVNNRGNLAVNWS